MKNAILRAVQFQSPAIAQAAGRHPALARSTFAVDALTREAQRVVPTYNLPPNNRFFVVDASGATEAIELGVAARAAGCCSIADFRAHLAFGVQPT